MNLKEQISKEYLENGYVYRKLQSKYGISRTTICKWVQIYQVFMALKEPKINKPKSKSKSYKIAPTLFDQQYFNGKIKRSTFCLIKSVYP